ncbi:polysaccharide pyruvyl transferase family protein [Microbacterium sp. MPKO10]|uniref:polysaccharide pyruvyl transferase family protein n=1 Tax=Microbacterium sp. MPKO10 TaxID=2989818 RepID=UPI002235AA8E|nr:polysaccharide pyruvyl transferase family protein [Microbacterium sp. MPKO10]MCW4458199.1 polysaccharide pyruvyl transferase family protein [Microbacterium sp. MPKO10]
MNCVVLGDIGWQYLYHLGDEAMTEAAIDLLQERGAEQVTLVAAQPHVAEKFYNRPAVARFGFSSKWSREKLERELDRVTGEMASGDSDLHKAVRKADAVIIAGGGNMNSEHAYHLYERLAFKRLAEAHSKPLFVSSQTIGPMLRPRDKELVAEIIDYAECFGAREPVSYQLAIDLGGTPGRVVQTMDDAMMLRALPADEKYVSDLGLSPKFIVGSFTSHQGDTGLTEEEYIASVTRTLDELAAKLDADVALAPHNGSLDTSARKGDQLLNDAIAEASTTGRLKSLEMPTARQVVALTERAILSISTRYHPTVFAPAAAVPTGSISLSYYSSVRMRGSMGNVGLKRYVVPATSWHVASEAFVEMAERREAYETHIGPIAESRHAYQSGWWDAIADAIKTRTWPMVENMQAVPELEPAGDWSVEVEHVTPVFDRFGQEKVWSKWFFQDRRAAWEERDRLAKQSSTLTTTVKDLEKKLEAAVSRKAVRAADKLGTVARRITRR